MRHECTGLQSLLLHTQQGLLTQAGPPSGGSCGYGVLNATSWPYGNIATISSQNPVVASLGSGGCGACLQISCTSQVRLLPPLPLYIRQLHRQLVHVLQGLCASNQSPVVLVVDADPDASLSIPPTLFAEIAPIQSGNAAVLLQQVRNPICSAVQCIQPASCTARVHL